MRALAVLLAVAVLGCTSTKGPRPHQRLFTDTYSIQVWMDPSPPRALEEITFRIVVRDKESGEPLDAGEGQIFATNEDRKNVDNGFTKTPEVGTYTSKLMFVTAGTWAVGLRFRKDSTSSLERANDWMQEVYPEAAPGEEGRKNP